MSQHLRLKRVKVSASPDVGNTPGGSEAQKLFNLTCQPSCVDHLLADPDVAEPVAKRPPH
ncbi:hypothetical protein P3T76_010558 [Phytophthora citrophthora]|uniref:Uncharacterized protein n=1 Tax=Phytophthora citrophthora TaxID=4793 RepID=A0AAD9LG18_9STRA|nr:hypothetical protein P3T76_010558 [Phytophthora citrophthora]